jgi:hypothetical protein
MIKGLLRGLVGLITLPIIVGFYWVISVGLVAFGAEPTGRFTDAVWGLGTAWVVGLIIYPVIARKLEKVIA